ncbi:MAG: HAMP domain-containing histidine kinase [Actinobacteria bacterium]|nr:HAMP domain-containing histidine kinase [Actinomycetota bacterium]
MRRRILLAIVGTVALALVLAGAGTYLLLGREADRATESGLRAQAEGLSALLDLSRTARLGAVRQQKVVSGLKLEGISVVLVGPKGKVRGELPPGVTAADLPTEQVLAGETLSGRHRELVWASASSPLARGGALAVVITRSSQRPRPPLGWFLLGGGAALAVGAAVAWGVSSDLTRPLRRAHDATRQIAAGDLAARLPDPSPGDRTEVADLTRSINDMAAALEHSRGLERQFLLSVSHDLRTPLTSIRGYAEAISDGTATDPAAAARVIGTEAQRLGRLVADLLDLARLDADGFTFAHQVVPVAEVVQEVVEGFRPTAEAAGVALHLGPVVRGTEARIDPDRLGQCVANLVENGLRYAAAALWVEARPAPGGGVLVAVADDGPGIAPDDLPRVFERLYADDRRPTRGPAPGSTAGSGLGLAIVHELVAAMGGRVRAESPAQPGGRGARFVIELPPPPAPSVPAPTPEG